MTSNILNSVSEKLNVDREELNVVYDYLIKGIIAETESDEVFGIRLGNLGYLVLNSRMLSSYMKRNPDNRSYGYRLKYLQYLKDTESKKYELHRNIPLELLYNRKYLKMKNVEPTHNKNLYNKIQKIQNGKK